MIQAARLLCVVTAALWATSSMAATEDVRTVVAQVGAEWSDEEKLRKFQAEMAAKYPDAPSLETLRDKDRWVVVVDLAEAKRAWSVAARTSGVGEVKKGDIVEVRYSQPAKAKTYEELPQVMRVICKASTDGYEDCKRATKMGAFDAKGKQVSWGDR